MMLRKSVWMPSSVEKKWRNTPAHTWPHTRCDMCARWWWAACWVHGKPGLVSLLLVWETETWLQSECMVRIPRSPVATVLKYESARPFFFPSLFFLCLLQTLISVPPLDPCTKAHQPLPRSFTRSILFSFKLPEHLFFPYNHERFFPFKHPLYKFQMLQYTLKQADSFTVADILPGVTREPVKQQM